MILTVPVDSAFYPTLGPQICDWVEEHLVFGPGDLRGQPYVFDEEKRALVYRMYEVHPRGSEMEGRRRFKRVGLSLAKGLAKTELAAIIAACELAPTAPVRCVEWQYDKRLKQWLPVGGPVSDPYIPMVAYTEEQSDELAYGALRAILEESPIADQFDIGLERIMRLSGDGKAVSLSASPNARDGARTTFAVLDETHLWTLPRLKQALQTMLNAIPKRKISDPWMLEVTTAPEPGAGSVAEATMEYAHAVMDGTVSDSTLFYFHRQAGDEHDLTTKEGARAAVVEASGPAAAWRDIDAIVSLWSDPTIDRTYWERVWANRLVKSASQAFDIIVWRARTRDDNPVKLGDTIVIGFDGSQFRDGTGLVPTHVESGYQWVAGVWEPKFGQENWQVPVAEVDAAVRDLFQKYNVWRMYVDPPYWQTQIAVWSAEFGEDRVLYWYTNRPRQMALALEGFDTALKVGPICHSGDKVLERHVANCRRKNLPSRDEQGKPHWVIEKERPDSPHKIDVAMAAVLSWEARTDAIAAGAGQAQTPQLFFVGGTRR